MGGIVLRGYGKNMTVGSTGAFSVSQINRYIKTLLDGDETLNEIVVRGETSNYKIYPSGHHYFTLKDAEGSLKCVMFKGSAETLSFRPTDGMQILAQGRISVYPRDGVYQLYCTRLIPDGEGALTQAFEELKRRLAEEGLFDASHKKPLPPYPMKIALVTSPAGAAVRDMIRIFKRRWPIAEIVIAPARVQGEEAPAEIAAVIRFLNRHFPVDLMIVGRGGGSLEDLWAFNDERVARAIFASRIPVISAVGHEPDVLISDFAADVRASTPSHAAELASPDAAEMIAWIGKAKSRILLGQKRYLESLGTVLKNRAAALKSPQRAIEERRLRLDQTGARILELTNRRVGDARKALAMRAGALDALSPLKVLGRGYSIVTAPDGAALRDARELKPGDMLTVRPARGKAQCKVESVEE